MGDPLEESSSQASLHSTTPAAATAAAATAPKGKGGHISALRSLGLLHELQEYVSACVETQQQQEKELGKLKAEKKEVQRVLKQKALHSTDKQQPCLQQFQASEISDLPPRLRALFEDNKVLKEQARRYKHRLQDTERHASVLEQQLLAAQASNSRLKAQLQDGDTGGQSAVELAQARQQAEGLNRALEKLQHAHQVLQQKLDTDGRLHRQALATAAKERQQLEQQVHELQEQLESKDREVRGQTLAAQQAQRKLNKIKAAAHKAVAGVDARLAEAAASAEARCKQLEAARVHLMLCVIKEPAAGGGRQQQQSRQQVLPVPGSEASHAGEGGIWVDGSSASLGKDAGVSSTYTGSLSREQAVLKLQAGARGFLTRKQIRLQRQQQGDALVLVQAGGCQPLAQGCTGEDANQAQGSGSSSANGSSGEPVSGWPAQGLDKALSGTFSLPMELPALHPAAAASGSSLAGVGSSTGGTLHTASSLSTAAVTGTAPMGGSKAAARSGRQQQASAAAANGRSRPFEAKKPAIPSFSRAPPASAPHPRATRQQNADSVGQHSSAASRGGTRSGPTSRTGAAAVAESAGAAASGGMLLESSKSAETQAIDAAGVGVQQALHSAQSGRSFLQAGSSRRSSRSAGGRGTHASPATTAAAAAGGRQQQRRQSVQASGAQQQQQPRPPLQQKQQVVSTLPRNISANVLHGT